MFSRDPCTPSTFPDLNFKLFNFIIHLLTSPLPRHKTERPNMASSAASSLSYSGLYAVGSMTTFVLSIVVSMMSARKLAAGKSLTSCFLDEHCKHVLTEQIKKWDLCGFYASLQGNYKQFTVSQGVICLRYPLFKVFGNKLGFGERCRII